MLLLLALVFSASQVTAEPRWRVERATSRMDDSQSVTLMMTASEPVREPLGYWSSPILVVLCKEGETSVAIVTKAPVQLQPRRHDATVMMRLDSAPAEHVVIKTSSDGRTLYLPDAIAVAQRLAASRRLLFRYAAVRTGEQETSFELDGLAPLLSEVAAACGWRHPQASPVP